MTQLLQNAVFGTALILAAALLRRVLGGRLIPEARLALWFVCLIRLLAPVFPESGLSLWGLLPRTEAASTPAPVPVGGAGNLPTVNAPAPGTVNPGLGPVEPAGAAFPWETVALSVWIGVGLVLAARYALAFARTRRAVRCAAPLERDDPRYALLPRCARLLEGAMDGAPLTFGAARPTVVLSPGLSGAALDCVLAHEGVHARRRDNLWHYAMAAALVVYWWNPAVWLMARLLRRDIELACDRAAVRRLGPEKRAQYAETLVALATAGAEPAFCQTFGRKAAEERILSVMKFKKTTVLGVVLSLALVAGVTVAFASGPKASAEKPAESKAPVIVENGDPVPVNASPVISEDGVPGAIADQPMTLEEYTALLDGLVSGGKMSREDYDRLLDGAAKGLESQISVGACPYLWVTEGGSYAIKGRRICTLAGCGNNSRHTHDGEWYTGWEDTVTYDGRTYNRADLSAETLEWLDWYRALPEEERLAVSYEPAELREQAVPEFVPDYDPEVEDSAGAGDEPAIGELGSSFYDYTIVGTDENGYPVDEQGNRLIFDDSGKLFMKVRSGYAPCVRMDCDISQEHHHEGAEVVYHYNTLPAELLVCPVEGCTVQGVHYHDGVIYRCNGAHCGGVCDGSCAAAWNGADTAPTNPPVSSGHHGAGHGNGYQGGHH